MKESKKTYPWATAHCFCCVLFVLFRKYLAVSETQIPFTTYSLFSLLPNLVSTNTRFIHVFIDSCLGLISNSLNGIRSAISRIYTNITHRICVLFHKFGSSLWNLSLAMFMADLSGTKQSLEKPMLCFSLPYRAAAKKSSYDCPHWLWIQYDAGGENNSRLSQLSMYIVQQLPIIFFKRKTPQTARVTISYSSNCDKLWLDLIHVCEMKRLCVYEMTLLNLVHRSSTTLNWASVPSGTLMISDPIAVRAFLIWFLLPFRNF